MLKRLLTLALASAALIGVAARDNSYFGVRSGMDVTFPTGSYNHYKVGSGFHVGGIYHLSLPRKFYFEPGLMFFYNGMSNKDLVRFDENYFYEGSGKFYGLRIPLNVGYTFTPNDLLEIGFYTGPQVNINLSARQGLDPNFSAPVPVPDKTIDLFKYGTKRVDGLWSFGLNLTFAQSYTVGLSGGVAFTPLAQYGNGDKKVKIYRSTVAITLGYNF